MEMTPIAVGDGVLETAVSGTGDPVVIVPTALVADETAPLARRLTSSFAVVHYRRRGYGRSGPAPRNRTIADDARDCAGLLDHLGIERAHVAGVSYSAAVALQLAADEPALVHSLTLVEPPPVHSRHDALFRQVSAQLLDDVRARGAEAAVEAFLVRVQGPDWRRDLDGVSRGGAARALADAPAFLDLDVPALLTWPFDAAAARGVGCPVLHVSGADHEPLFASVGDLLDSWLPQVGHVVVPGASHGVALTHPDALAATMIAFLRRHPLP